MAQLVNILDQNNSPDEAPDTVVVGSEAAPEPTPDTAGNQEEAQKFAGKYNSVEDLEKGYANLEKMAGGTGQKMDGLQQQNQQLLDRLTSMEQTQQQAAQQQVQQQAAPDYDGMRSAIGKQMDDGDLGFADGLQQIRAIDAEQQSIAAEQQQQANLQATQEQFQAELAQRDEQAMITDFHKDNPDFAQLQESGAFEEIKASNRYVNDDYQAYLTLKASNAFNEGKDAAVKEVAGSQPAESVSASPGSAMKTETKPPMTRSATKTEMLQSGIAAFEGAMGG